jgi:hypothetical protein
VWVFVGKDVSEELVATISRVEIIYKFETKLTVRNRL